MSRQDRFGEPLHFYTQPVDQARYRVIPVGFHPGRFERYTGLARVMKTHRPDITIAAHECFAFASIQSLFLSRMLFGARHVTISCSLQNLPYAWDRLSVRLREGLAFRSATAILASCRDAEDLLRLRGYRGRTEIIYPLGAATNAAPDGIDTAHDDRPLTVGYVGRLSWEKGIFDLIEAFALLESNLRLLLVGDGPDRAAVERLIATKNLSHRVEIAGFVPREEVGEYFSRMDVLVLPSRSTMKWKEQFGVVLGEAMQAGVAVVGSSSGAIPEVVGDAGYIFPEGEVAALAHCLRTLCTSPDSLPHCRLRSRRRAERLFSPKAIAGRMANLFAELRKGV